MRYSIIAALLYLTGCSSYFLANYDTNEYALINDIRTTAELSKSHCKDVAYMRNASEIILYKATAFKNFTSGFGHNEDSISAASNLLNIAKGLNEKYNSGVVPSIAYCESKVSSLEDTSKAIQTTIARKPR